MIGVVLSGMLDDGTAGLLAVKRCGGLAVVQDPDDALHGEMPRSALDYVAVDHIATLAEFPPLLMHLASQPSGPAVIPPHDLVVEASMAEAESGDTRRTEQIGRLSALACPECNGPLWQIGNESFQRYRCHTGHAFTARALTYELAEATERALWVALQTMEERGRMLRRLAKQEQQFDRLRSSDRYNEEADELQNHARLVRELLVNDHPMPSGAPKADTA